MQKNKFSNNPFFTLWKLQWDHYRKDTVQIILGWIVTSLTLISWLTFKDTSPNKIESDAFVLASAIGVGTIRNCIFNLAKTIHDFKAHGVFNKLFSTSISKRFVFINILAFNQMWNIFISIFLFAIGMLYVDQRAILHNVNWAMFFAAYILLVILCSLIGFTIALSIRHGEKTIVCANVFYYGSSYLLGLGIPYKYIASNPYFKYISYLFPHRAALNFLQASWVNSQDMTIYSPIDHSKMYDFGIGNTFWIPVAITLVIILVFILSTTLLMVKTFEFGTRRFKRYQNANENIMFINMIKKANTKEELIQVVELARKQRKNLKRIKGVKHNEKESNFTEKS